MVFLDEFVLNKNEMIKSLVAGKSSDLESVGNKSFFYEKIRTIGGDGGTRKETKNVGHSSLVQISFLRCRVSARFQSQLGNPTVFQS